jgi:hypothetical protein
MVRLSSLDGWLEPVALKMMAWDGQEEVMEMSLIFI